MFLKYLIYNHILFKGFLLLNCMNYAKGNYELFKKTSKSFFLASRLFFPKNIEKVNTILYLVSRIADTIEDCDLKIDEKKKYFEQFRKALVSGNIKDFRKNDILGNVDLPQIDYDIIINSEKIMNDFKTIQEPVKNIIIRNVSEMTMGMEKFLEKRIMTFKDQDEYCHYVAGTVGKSLTEIYRHFGSESDMVQYNRMLERVNNFGLSLQKVNIMKGIRADYNANKNNNEANKIYVPQGLLDNSHLSLENVFDEKFREKSLTVLDGLKKDSLSQFDISLDYLFSIPYSETGIRRFSFAIFFSSFLMLSKLNGNYEVFSSDEEIGLSKTESLGILSRTYLDASTNSRVEKDYLKLRELIE